MGGGGGQRGSSVVSSNPAPPQIAPEFQPFAAQVGSRALGHLNEFNLSDFAQSLPLQVPGLNNMQRGALTETGQRFNQGIPTPEGEQQAQATNSILPTIAGQQVGLDPLRMEAYN